MDSEKLVCPTLTDLVAGGGRLRCGFEGLADDGADAVLLFGGEGGAGGEAEAVGEEVFCDGALVDGVHLVDGLEVEGFPDGAGFDILSVEREADGFAVDFGNGWINREAGEPAGAAVPRGFGHEGDSRQVTELLNIAIKHGPARVDAVAQVAQLATADGGEEIAEPVIEADLGVLVVGGRVAGLTCKHAGAGDQAGVGSDQYTATGCGDNLVAVE